MGRGDEVFETELQQIQAAGLTKVEREILGPQGSHIRARRDAAPAREVLNFCANNYLGLSSHPRVVAAARAALETYGFGMSSVRFICGTLDAHRQLERRLAAFVGMDDAILYSSCFDANGGLFETLLGPEDAIISDALNHASVIDGIRLSKAERHRYAHGSMEELEDALKKTQSKRLRLIATDGVFSMDGFLAKLPEICDLADRYNAMVMVDDSHATGFVGPSGKGTLEALGVMGRIDIVTSTLGKALGGASGGFTAASHSVVELLRQRSRPYLFSNALPPPIVMATLTALDIVETDASPRKRLEENAARFRREIAAMGYTIKPGTHPIVPLMIGDAREASALASRLYDDGVYVVGFSFPVVPRGEARIRVQLSAAHSPEDITQVLAAFARARAI